MSWSFSFWNSGSAGEDATLKPLTDSVSDLSLSATVPVPLIQTVTSTGSISPAPSIVICSPTGVIALTLPQSADFVGKQYLVTNSSENEVTILPFGTDTINYTTAKLLSSAGTRTQLTSDGAGNWIAL